MRNPLEWSGFRSHLNQTVIVALSRCRQEYRKRFKEDPGMDWAWSLLQKELRDIKALYKIKEHHRG